MNVAIQVSACLLSMVFPHKLLLSRTCITHVANYHSIFNGFLVSHFMYCTDLLDSAIKHLLLIVIPLLIMTFGRKLMIVRIWTCDCQLQDNY